MRAVRACSPRLYFIPDYLAPALASPLRRAPSRRKRNTHSSSHAAPLSSSSRTTWRIPIPEPNVRNDIGPWIAAIDAFLPPHLRHPAGAPTDLVPPVTAFDFSRVLNEAQKASHDILTHMGLAEGRWDATAWIVRKLVEDDPSVRVPIPQLEASANIKWPETELRTLEDLVERPVVAQRLGPYKNLRNSLNDLTALPESIDPNRVAVKRALGQVWRSLGTMVLAAAEEPQSEDPSIMSHVLEIIAHLHHVGLIPDSVYTARPVRHYAIQQPPTLHLLSSPILTALSDAAWRAREASVKVAQERYNASYFLGREIPGSRFKVKVPEVVPELWLELILWSCLHGGWLLDATAILEKMAAQRAEREWGVISWREVLQGEEEESATSSTWTWRLFSKRADASSKAKARARTRRKISSEIVTACVDGLVNTMRVGVGFRGTDPEELVDHIKQLKGLLDRNAHSLGSATWDSVMMRLLETGGVIPEKRPELLLSIAGLASRFGSEVASANASTELSTASTEPPYFFEPSTTPISLLHRAIMSFIQLGDISGAITALNTLRHYTDSNKQESLRHFFETLKGVPFSPDEPFTSRIPPIDFPAFDPQLSVPLLAKLLDLITDTRMFELGRWLLLSEELDGPLITPEMYSNPKIAASIVRFGTLAGENDLVLKIVKKASVWNSRMRSHRLPGELYTSMLGAQIQLHRWDTVQSMQNYVLENPGYLPTPGLLATFAGELLRLSNEETSATGLEISKGRDAFAGLLYSWEGLIMTRSGNELNCILGIMSSVHDEWKEYCSQFLGFSRRQKIRLSADNFNQLLAGVLDGYGSSKGKALVDRWCYTTGKALAPYRASGGLSTMPHFRAGKRDDFQEQPPDIEITPQAGVELTFQGRVHPNRQTVWAILRRVQQEEDQRSASTTDLTADKRAEVRKTLQWAARLLYRMGFDYDDIIRDLGSLAEIAELERPAVPKPEGTPEDE